MIPPDVRTESTPCMEDFNMSDLFDSDYEASVKITNVNNFIKAVASSFKTIIEAACEKQLSIKEKLSQGAQAYANEVFAAKAEAEKADEQEQEETVTVLKTDWDQLVKLAQLFRKHPEATEGYKISVGADLAGTVIYVNDHIVK